MARPANANAEETRRKILAVAIVEFAREGFHGTSTRVLAMIARVNIATLHYYFGSKQKLYDATIDEVYRRLSERTRGALADGPRDNIETVVGRLYYAARAERDGIRLLLREVLDHGRLRPHTESQHFLPSLEQSATLAQKALGVDPVAARTTVVALGFLISRYVIQDDASLKAAFAVRTAAEAHARAVTTIVTAAHALLAKQE